MNNVYRWNPFREIAEMQRQFDRVFDDAWNTSESRYTSNWMPIDVTEAESGYQVVADLPGLSVDDISVNFHDGLLTISGEIVDNSEANENKVLVRERTYGKFSRQINLSMPIDIDSIEASYDNGVLTLTLPKAESAKPRQIAINKQNLLDSKN